MGNRLPFLVLNILYYEHMFNIFCTFVGWYLNSTGLSHPYIDNVDITLRQRAPLYELSNFTKLYKLSKLYKLLNSCELPLHPPPTTVKPWLIQDSGVVAYFAIYDTDTSELVFLPNPAKDADSAAGPAAVRFAVGQKVNKIISGHFGNKVTPLLWKTWGLKFKSKKTNRKLFQTIINQLKI